MLRSYCRIIESGRHRVSHHDLPIPVLQEIGLCPLKNACGSCGESGGMPSCPDPQSSRLHADHPDTGVIHERVEKPDGITLSPDTGYNAVGGAPLCLKDLLPRLSPYDRLEISD